MASIGRGNLRCKADKCNRVRPYWSDYCKRHREQKPDDAITNEPTLIERTERDDDDNSGK